MKHNFTSKINYHFIIFAILGCLFLFSMIRLFLWNQGIKSDYNPNETTTEFDVESLDYIQPLTASMLEGKVEDDTYQILYLGNSPFSDDKSQNGLAQKMSSSVDAITHNLSFANSFLSLKNTEYSSSYPADGISLYHIVNALCSQDYTILDDAVAQYGTEELATLDALKSLDMTKIDSLVIMYDLSDYIDKRPVTDPNDENNLLTFSGSLNASISLLQETYPYIRIFVMSSPASGKTIDNFYVDGDIHDLGNGTMADYLHYQAVASISKGVSFIDHYYGTINVDNRNSYLVDDYHLNAAGIEAIVNRVSTLLAP